MRKYFLLLMVLCFLVGDLHGESVVPPAAEIRHKECASQCRNIYREVYNNGKIEMRKRLVLLYDYKNHYNRRLNRCFMLISETSVLGRKKILTDIAEDKVYGTLRVNRNNQVISCLFGEERCKSEDEWNKIVKPFMEE